MRTAAAINLPPWRLNILDILFALFSLLSYLLFRQTLGAYMFRFPFPSFLPTSFPCENTAKGGVSVLWSRSGKKHVEKGTARSVGRYIEIDS